MLELVGVSPRSARRGLVVAWLFTLSVGIPTQAAAQATLLLPASASLGPSKPQADLVYGVEMNSAPYGFVANGRPDGFVIRVLARAATKAGLRIDIRVGSWSQIVQDLDHGIIDVTAMQQTPEREGAYNWLIELTQLRSVIAFAPGRTPPQSIADLRGETIAVMRGSAFQLLLEAIPDPPRLLTTPDTREAVAALANGTVTAVAANGLTLRDRAHELGLPPLATMPLKMHHYGIASRRGQDNRTRALRAALVEMAEAGEIRGFEEQMLVSAYPAVSWRRYLPAAAILALAAALVLGGVLLWNRVLRRRVNERTRELRTARDEALHVTRAKDAFMASIGDRLRWPLQGMAEMQTALGRTDLSAAQQAMVVASQQTSEQLLEVVNSLLDYARLESGQLVVDRLPTRLRGVVDDVRAVAIRLMGTRDLRLSIAVADDLPTYVWIDPKRLHQVLVSVVSTSIRSAVGNEIRIDVSLVTRAGARWLSFAVSNSGGDLAPEVAARLLAPATQGPSPDMVTEHGLGLAVGSQLATLMGGSITFHGMPGQVTGFVVQLPCDAAFAPLFSSPDQATSRPTRQPATVVDLDHRMELRPSALSASWSTEQH